MDKLGVVLNALQHCARLLHVSVKHLLAGDFSHDMHQFGVEKALLTRMCLQRPLLQLEQGLLIGEGDLDRTGCVQTQRENKKENRGKQRVSGEACLHGES